ncbi:ankyrin repeat domain-containing protein [Novosphingobium sp. YAF33]|uniref:ankyrin repeat domain-containing protein n=1 Tax=Novosphingobium sp. YAF33 TaxID=3233082 RepID=UPI003F96C2C2
MTGSIETHGKAGASRRDQQSVDDQRRDQGPLRSVNDSSLPSPERIQELLFEAARIGRDDMITPLINAGADLEARDIKGHTALVLATYNGQETTTGLLLGLGAAPDGDTVSGSPLMGVCFKGHLRIAKKLIDAGADVDQRNSAGQTALMMASLFGHRDIIDLLVSNGADLRAIDAAGNDAVSLARAQGNEEIASWLMELAS